MSSPLPPDPYAALSVSKDADIGQIRSAHRKLALKFHPDRIKGDDLEEKDRAKNEFQRVQQAYEILSDPSRRSRYDDQVRLAELQRERLLREPTRPTAYTSKTTPASTSVRTEMRSDGVRVEERAPPTSYFDTRDRFEDPLPTRASARKYEVPHERERKPSVAKPTEKREKVSSKIASPVEGISLKQAFHLKAHAAKARDRVREGHAKNQETRDREKRSARDEKDSSRRPAYAEVHSESDSDTVVPKPTSRSTRSSPRPKRDELPRARPGGAMRSVYGTEEESYSEGEKWERHHKSSMDYIAESKRRPGVSRNESDAYVYWGGDIGGKSKSGSDSEKRPSSSRRTRTDETRSRPSMPAHSSAPSNLKPYVEERAPQRAKTTPYPTERAERPSAPTLGRSQTMPTNKSSKKDTAPTRGSNLKHGETQDSGYYSSSNPVTPEMKGESPPPSRENSKKKQTSSSTKYQIVSPDSDDDRASHVRILDSDDEGNRRRRFRSPEPDRREKDRDRDRERERDRDRDKERERDRDRDRARPRERDRPTRTESDSYTHTTRGPPPTSYNRNDFHKAPSSRGPPNGRSKLYGEISSDEKEVPYNYQYDPNRVKTSSYKAPATASYSAPRFRDSDEDYAPGSTFREHMRNPYSRRPSTTSTAY